MPILTIILMVPVFILHFLKFLGEVIGNLLAYVVLISVQYVPKVIRVLLVSVCITYTLIFYNFPSWALYLLLISTILTIIAPYVIEIQLNKLYNSKFNSFEAIIIFIIVQLIILHQIYLFSTTLSYNFICQLIITLMLSAAPIYTLRSIYRGYSVGVNLQKQIRRNKVAKQIFKSIEKGKKKSFSLFLRGFETNNRLRYTIVPPLKNWITDGGRYTTKDEYALYPPHSNADNLKAMIDDFAIDDIENILLKVYQSKNPLITLGKPFESFGAGRLTANENNWEDKVLSFMRFANEILVVPIKRKGTISEIKQIIELGYLPKTIFIMPSIISGRSYAKSGSSYEKYWEEIREELKDSLLLPKFQSEGAIFKILLNNEFIIESAYWNDEISSLYIKYCINKLNENYKNLIKDNYSH